MQKPTTTSYVILGLLALRSWSTYELAQQMQRSIRFYWPRAESGIYEEPKKLVALGFATAAREDVGRRRRTVYSITSDGRRALARWLAEPGRAPSVEFEGLVKVLYADHATKPELHATLAAIRAEAEAQVEHHAALAADLAETGGPFPDRLHVNAVVLRFLWEQSNALLRWVVWAEEEVALWDDDVAPPAGNDTADTLRKLTGSGG